MGPPEGRSRESSRQALDRLLGLLSRYGGSLAAEKTSLLTRLRSTPFKTAKDIVDLNRAASFLRAFPDDDAVHAAAVALGECLQARVAGLSREERAKLDDSAIAGSVSRHTYSAVAARWLAHRFPAVADIDWRAFENAMDLGPALQPLLNPMEDEVTDFSGTGLKRWLHEAKGAPGAPREPSDLVWLMAQPPPSGSTATAFAHQYDIVEVPLQWTIESRSSIAGNALKRAVNCRDGMRRPADDPRQAIARDLESFTHLSARVARKVIDVWRTALWGRARTVLQIEEADDRACYLAELGEGVEMAIVGVKPASRALLEVNYGYLLMSNGVPIGYGGFTPLFSQVNTGINVFPDFRGSEAAFIWQEALRTMRTMTGCARFIINPYQLGDGNEEALRSGAYWFYYRLGFRSAAAEARKLAGEEFARMGNDRSYRPPLATMRRIAAGDVYLDIDRDAAPHYFPEALLESLGRRVTSQIAREGPLRRSDAIEAMSRRLARTLGADIDTWSREDRQGLARLAPILSQIEDLGTWTETERRALADIVRARMAPSELPFIADMRRHDRLRKALIMAAEAA